eukprot:SAG22_NODE_20_length_32168_cov_40.859241_13_plen_63_part_00
MGGGGATYGLWLDDTFTNGTTGTCTTFQNPPLCALDNPDPDYDGSSAVAFTCKEFEVWGVDL